MKNLEKTKNAIYDIFNRWLNDKINDEQLVNLLKRKLGKCWFRFFKGDTSANDYNNVYHSLRSPNNRKFLKECMLLSIETKGLQVYDYSGKEILK